MDQPSPEITRILHDIRSGKPDAIHELFPLVYDQLVDLARKQRLRWQGDYTLNTTAIVHEAYLRLAGHMNTDWNDRIHFFGVAGKAMRHILVDYAKRKHAAKRGGNQVIEPLDEMVMELEDRTEEVLHLDEALTRLERVNARASKVVELRFFAGLSIKDTATTLDVSPATITREWRLARAWLYREMNRD